MGIVIRNIMGLLFSLITGMVFKKILSVARGVIWIFRSSGVVLTFSLPLGLAFTVTMATVIRPALAIAFSMVVVGISSMSFSLIVLAEEIISRLFSTVTGLVGGMVFSLFSVVVSVSVSILGGTVVGLVLARCPLVRNPLAGSLVPRLGCKIFKSEGGGGGDVQNRLQKHIKHVIITDYQSFSCPLKSEKYWLEITDSHTHLV